MRKTVISILVILALVGVSRVQAGAQFFLMGNPLVGGAAPDFDLDDLDNQPQKFSDISRGQDTIIFFWATWCPHCRSQLQELKNGVAQLEKSGINVLLIDLGEDAGTVRPFLAKGRIEFKTLLDLGGEVADQYKVIGIPTFVFVDKQGMIRAVENFLPKDYLDLFSEEKK